MAELLNANCTRLEIDPSEVRGHSSGRRSEVSFETSGRDYTQKDAKYHLAGARPRYEGHEKGGNRTLEMTYGGRATATAQEIPQANYGHTYSSFTVAGAHAVVGDQYNQHDERPHHERWLMQGNRNMYHIHNYYSDHRRDGEGFKASQFERYHDCPPNPVQIDHVGANGGSGDTSSLSDGIRALGEGVRGRDIQCYCCITDRACVRNTFTGGLLWSGLLQMPRWMHTTSHWSSCWKPEPHRCFVYT